MMRHCEMLLDSERQKAKIKRQKGRITRTHQNEMPSSLPFDFCLLPFAFLIKQRPHRSDSYRAPYSYRRAIIGSTFVARRAGR